MIVKTSMKTVKTPKAERCLVAAPRVSKFQPYRLGGTVYINPLLSSELEQQAAAKARERREDHHSAAYAAFNSLFRD